MDKEAVVHMCNGILLSHKTEQIGVSCSEVDECRACYTELSQKNKYHILTHIRMESRKRVLMNLFTGQE